MTKNTAARLRVLMGAIILLTTGAGTVGCSSFPNPLKPTTDAPKACDVLTIDVVKPYIGDDAAKSREAQPNPRETQCQYTSSTGAINVMVGEWSVIKPIGSDEQPVGGIGDEAWISPTGLAVKKGSHGIEINAMLASGEFSGAAADELQAKEADAEKALAGQLVPKI